MEGGVNTIRRGAVRALLLACVLCLAAATVAAQPDPPALTAPVNDFAGVLDAGTAQQLDALIRRLQNATGDVLVVATVKTFQPWPDMNAYAVKMFENGGKGIGQKGKDNGVLLVLALDDRQVRVETGYDLEAFITDGFAGETSRGMVPFFREGEYGRGLLAGATRLAERIAQGRNVDLNLTPVPAPRSSTGGRGGIPIGFWVILLIIFLNMMGGGRRGRGRRSGRWASGVGGFGGGFGGGWGGSGGFGGGFGGFGGGRSGGGGGGASW
jgi:uncharacterized protein